MLSVGRQVWVLHESTVNDDPARVVLDVVTAWVVSADAETACLVRGANVFFAAVGDVYLTEAAAVEAREALAGARLDRGGV